MTRTVQVVYLISVSHVHMAYEKTSSMSINASSNIVTYSGLQPHRNTEVKKLNFVSKASKVHNKESKMTRCIKTRRIMTVINGIKSAEHSTDARFGMQNMT